MVRVAAWPSQQATELSARRGSKRWKLTRLTHFGSVPWEAARKRGFPVTTGPVLVQTVKEDWREAANKWLIRWIDEHPDRPLAAEYAAEIDEANDLREQIGASTDPWWMRNPEPDEGGTI